MKYKNKDFFFYKDDGSTFMVELSYNRKKKKFKNEFDYIKTSLINMILKKINTLNEDSKQPCKTSKLKKIVDRLKTRWYTMLIVKNNRSKDDENGQG